MGLLRAYHTIADGTAIYDDGSPPSAALIRRTALLGQRA
jgi:hypothetical protein